MRMTGASQSIFDYRYIIGFKGKIANESDPENKRYVEEIEI